MCLIPIGVGGSVNICNTEWCLVCPPGVINFLGKICGKMKRIQAQKEMARMASSTLEIDVPKVGNPQKPRRVDGTKFWECPVVQKYRKAFFWSLFVLFKRVL